METCPICLELLSENITTTNCNHTFCSECFDELMDNNKIQCPLCRTLIKEYINNGEKVRVLIKANNRRTSHTNVNVLGDGLNARLITRNELRRYNIRNYVYSLLILYMCYSYLNCSLMLHNTQTMYDDCERLNNNITESYRDVFDGSIPITLYDFETNHMSKVCMIPTYFYNKCFNL